MSLISVRSSWLILARNCDLCRLASASWRLFSWISSNRRIFSMAIPAWSAKVTTNSICLSVNGRIEFRAKVITPIGVPSAALERQARYETDVGRRAGAHRCILDQPERREHEQFFVGAKRVPKPSFRQFEKDELRRIRQARVKVCSS